MATLKLLWRGEMGLSEHFPVELVAHVGVLVVEESVGPGAAGVDALLRLLHERPVAAVHVVRQLARLVVTFAGGERFNSKKIQLEVGLERRVELGLHAFSSSYM